MHKLADLRAGDVMIFLSVVRCASVTGAARELTITPSQVSKSVARLEEQLGVHLMVRSTRGITISDAGNRLLPQLTEVVQRIQALDRREGVDTAIAIAAPSYIVAWSAPHIAAALGNTRVRAIEMAPALIRTLAALNLFDVCITLASEPLPDTWVSVQVGEMRRSCFVPPAVAAQLPSPITPDALRTVPFTLPVFNSNGVYVPIDDGCPLQASQRVAGHEAPTMALALEIASVTQQAVFGPVMAAASFIASGRMVELTVEGWDLRDPVFVTCNVDRVRASQQRQICEAVSTSLAAWRRSE